MRRPNAAACAAALFAGALLATPAAAQDFFRGKTLRLVVGYSTGGGYDQYARLLARHIGRHIPGAPAVIVENMPGAASLKSVQYLDHGAATDGTVVTTFDPGLITQSLTVPERVTIRFSDYPAIGNIAEDNRVCFAWHKTGIASFADLKARDRVVLGNSGVGTSSYVNARMLIDLFGVRLQMVQGYPGSAEKRIAIENGELDGDCGSWVAVPADWLRDNKIRLLVSFSETLPPGVPASLPYAADLLPDPAKRPVYELLMGPSRLGRPFIAPKAVPPDRVALLRAGFDATMGDAGFLAEAQKQNLLVTPMSGPVMDSAIRTILAAPREAIAEARRISGD